MHGWIDSVKRDLTPFADPGVLIRYVESENALDAVWRSRRFERRATFRLVEDDQISVSVLETTMDYRSFLASESMSDLLGVARMMLSDERDTIYVSTRGRRSGDLITSPALSLLNQATTDAKDGATNILFITGDAGAGKTEVLRRLVRQQAELYVRGEATFLYLYVNAQGRALARLEEALATEIQDLRAGSLTYHVVPSLARNGLLIPVIDGFDELLGTGGYDDAFSSLRRFIEELSRRGVVIASARDTYYQQELLSRTGRSALTNGSLVIDPIEVLPWNDLEFREYIKLRYQDEHNPKITLEHFRDRITLAFSSEESRELKSKPFFVAKVADLVLSTSGDPGAQISLHDLLRRYVERERSEKLLDRNGDPLLNQEQVVLFMRLLADEMWALETRSLDLDTVRTVAELAFERDDLSQEAQALVRERASTMALFSTAQGKGRIEFEHELFFSYFLGLSLYNSFDEGPDALYVIIRRSKLPDYAANFAAQSSTGSRLSLKNIVDVCSGAATTGGFVASQAPENAGAIIASSFRSYGAEGSRAQDLIVVEGIVFAGENFAQTRFDNVTFNNVEFKRCDFSRTTFHDCIVKNTRFYDVTVDPTSTVLGFRYMEDTSNFVGLKTRNQGSMTQLYRLESVQDALKACGLTISVAARAPQVQTDVIDLLERLLRKYEKSTLFWPTDTENRSLTVEVNWLALEKLLCDCGIVTLETAGQQKGSPRVSLRRNFLPHQIMSGESQKTSIPPIDKFWSLMSGQFPFTKAQKGPN